MSKNYNNSKQNNNPRKKQNYNREERTTFNNEVKRAPKRPKVNPNEFKLPLFLPADLDENVLNEILDVLASTKFDKISIPLGTYRWVIETLADGQARDERICTIGYIRGYDAENVEFKVIVYDKFVDAIKENGNLAMGLTFTSKDSALGTITKFNIIPVNAEAATCDNI